MPRPSALFGRVPWRLAWIVLFPLAVAASRILPHSLLVFVLSAAAIVPLAASMGRATDSLARLAPPGVSGLLTATFGNAAELIIGIVAIRAGELQLVKASISGSIIGNLLLVLGLAMVIGGARRVEQSFPEASASIHSTMLVLAVIGLVVPAVFLHAPRVSATSVEQLSVAVALVLIVVYGAGLVFTFVTHRAIFAPGGTAGVEAAAAMGLWPAVGLLALSAALVAWMSDLLISSLGAATSGLGLSRLFLGVVVIPVIGNAAEHYSAIRMAMVDRMDVALDIAVGSSTQVALFVAPLLVLISLGAGRPMSLLFETVELVAIGVSVAITAFIAHDAKSNWLEGVQLLAVYFILALAFFFIPA